ncbi:hypothetical protein [uncultured Nocardioides sp.]|uniref:hypothetical protein n=1 Tax=uncultured Nocardioides sp. TaxID=198441 RepID=UPI0026187E85|nr:hypothetical protein [uncultured Nocardioides sp.]
MTQVYGGAGRVYPVGHEWASEPRRSPLRFAYGAAEGPKATAALIDDALRMATEAGLFDVARTTERARLTGVVAGIVADRAMVKLDGRMGIVPDALAFPGLPLERTLRIGQELTGLYDADSRWFDVRASRLTPDVALSSYAADDVVLVQVESVESDRASAFLHPLVTADLPRGAVTSNPLDDLSDLLTPGEVLLARVVSGGGDWELSLLDIDDDDEPVTAAALYPGGPPWLVPTVPDDVVEPALPAADPIKLVTFVDDAETEVDDGGASDDRAAPDSPHAAAPTRVTPSPTMFDRNRPRLRPALAPAPAPATVAAPRPGPESASTRSMSLTIASLQSEVRTARRQRDEVHAQAQGFATELEHLRTELRQVEDQVRRLTHQLEQSRAKLRKSRTTSAATGAPSFADPAREFRFLVERAWATRIPLAEQPSCPLGDYTFGPHFLRSLASLHGLAADRVADVVMEVATGKAALSAGRELHHLRTEDAGGSPQRVREDGARAWRVSLQSNTPAARRLHYWVLSDGSIELAKVGVHDDMSI